MNILRYKTRQWLINANRSEFNDIIYQAKLTPRQTHIVYRKFIDCYSICKISQEGLTLTLVVFEFLTLSII